MNRKILCSAIFISSFFLIFLGMRNPYLSGDHAPKPRPRAIAEDSTKKSFEIVEQLKAEVACPPVNCCTVPAQLITALAPVKEYPRFNPVLPANLPARASPSSLS
jgi:hypothetical protein